MQKMTHVPRPNFIKSLSTFIFKPIGANFFMPFLPFIPPAKLNNIQSRNIIFRVCENSAVPKIFHFYNIKNALSYP